MYGNNYYVDGSLNEGQVLYNALYCYGKRTLDGYKYMESAVSTAHKLYAYGSFCKQRKGFTMIDTSQEAICNYANKEWEYEFVNIAEEDLDVREVSIDD